MLSSYSPLEPKVLPLFGFYIGIILFSIFMTVAMFLKYKERKVDAPKYLAIVFLILTIAVIAITIGLGEAVITGFYKEVYRFSLPFAYTSIIVADIFLYLFATEIVQAGKKLLPIFIIIGVFIGVLLWLPWNWWGFPSTDYEGQLNTRIYSTLGLIAYSYVIYIYIASICWQARLKTDDKIASRALELLFLSMFCMIGFFGMFAIDTVLIMLGDPGYTIYVYLAWVFAILFYITAYLSLVMPDWFKKLITK